MLHRKPLQENISVHNLEDEAHRYVAGTKLREMSKGRETEKGSADKMLSKRRSKRMRGAFVQKLKQNANERRECEREGLGC